MVNSILKLDVGLNPTLVIENTNRVLPRDIIERIDDIWHAALPERYSGLFNGVIFCAQSIERNRISVFRAEYKQYFAQITDPLFLGDINLQPLACSGVLTCTDGIIVGKRASTVALDPNLWELAPAGTFDEKCVNDGTLDATTLLLNEAEEELGIPKKLLQVGEVLAVVQEQKTQAIDLMVRAHVPITEADVQKYFENSPCPEYSQVRVIQPSGISNFVENNREDLNSIFKAGLTYSDI